LAGSRCTAGEQTGGQQSIGSDIQKRQQIELLKNHTHVLATQLVPLHGPQGRQVLTQYLADTLLDLLNASQQGQQGAFATATGPLNEQMLALR
jgi:hypothetical protein